MKLRYFFLPVVACLVGASAHAVEPQNVGHALPQFGEVDAVKRVAEHAAALALTFSNTPKFSGDSASVEVQVADKTCLVTLVALPLPKANQVYKPDDVWKVTGLACK